MINEAHKQACEARGDDTLFASKCGREQALEEVLKIVERIDGPNDGCMDI
jgi:hypothetical protein